MGTQFLLSLIGGAIAGGGLLLIAGRYAYKWYKKEKITIHGETIAIVSILLLTGALSAYKLAESSYHLAQDGVTYAKGGVKSALHTGQEVIEKTLKWGTVTLLEGVGQPYHDYQKKWREDDATPMKQVNIEVVSKSSKVIENQQIIHLVIDVTNIGDKPINLNNLLSQEYIVLTDKKNNVYSLKKLNYNNATIQAGDHALHEMEIVLPKGIELNQLATPMKQLLLK